MSSEAKGGPSRPTTSHGLPARDPAEVHRPDDLLFLGEGVGAEIHAERDPLLQELYVASLTSRFDPDAIDRLLDAHRVRYGEPEQVAAARQRDLCHDRAPPVTDGRKSSLGSASYFAEHAGWNPPASKELPARPIVTPPGRR